MSNVLDPTFCPSWSRSKLFANVITRRQKSPLARKDFRAKVPSPTEKVSQFFSTIGQPSLPLSGRSPDMTEVLLTGTLRSLNSIKNHWATYVRLEGYYANVWVKMILPGESYGMTNPPLYLIKCWLSEKHTLRASLFCWIIPYILIQ